MQSLQVEGGIGAAAFLLLPTTTDPLCMLLPPVPALPPRLLLPPLCLCCHHGCYHHPCLCCHQVCYCLNHQCPHLCSSPLLPTPPPLLPPSLSTTPLPSPVPLTLPPHCSLPPSRPLLSPAAPHPPPRAASSALFPTVFPQFQSPCPPAPHPALPCLPPCSSNPSPPTSFPPSTLPTPTPPQLEAAGACTLDNLFADPRHLTEGVMHWLRPGLLAATAITSNGLLHLWWARLAKCVDMCFAPAAYWPLHCSCTHGWRRGGGRCTCTHVRVPLLA